ncbi:condensin complex subunit 1 [Scaptodrosophila lebanonensis]|uniref:Condensin complex subunit 1 n=1 Tax=Drosophila lebanonensis TaxID=7225 RepID=A0A6J2U794_DROLE|nr:condensin complex subunit 1 [Scaptodrosophila lebanonensis]
MADNRVCKFFIPYRSADLLKARGKQYCVRKLYKQNEIPERLLVCRKKMLAGDIFYIFEHFDTYYSVIESKDADAVTVQNLMRSFDLLYLTVNKLTAQLAPLLAPNAQPLSVPNRTRYWNLTKMSLYLLINAVKRINALSVDKTSNFNVMLKQNPDWIPRLSKFFLQLYIIIKYPLEKLWTPSVVDANFVNMICDICYCTLEVNPASTQNLHIFDSIFKILGAAIRKFNHALIFCARILPILRTNRSTSIVVAKGMQLIHEDYDLSPVVTTLMDHIMQTKSRESAHSAIMHNYAAFITELVGNSPGLMIMYFSQLSDELLQSLGYRNKYEQIFSGEFSEVFTDSELKLSNLKSTIRDRIQKLSNLKHVNEDKYETLVQKVLLKQVSNTCVDPKFVLPRVDFVVSAEIISKLLKLEDQYLYILILFKNLIHLTRTCGNVPKPEPKQLNIIQFLIESIDFKFVVSNAMPKLLQTLAAEDKEDIYEELDLFSSGYNYGMRGLELAMTSLLPLVGSSSELKRRVICHAYRRVFFNSEPAGRERAIKVVRILCKLLAEVEFGHYRTMELLMAEWIRTGSIDAYIVQILFERWALLIKGTTPNESRLALQLIIMASRAERRIATYNRGFIENIAIKERTLEDPFLIYQCIQLLVMGSDCTNGKLQKSYTVQDKFVEYITTSFLSNFSYQEMRDFDYLAVGVIEFYKLVCIKSESLAAQVFLEVINCINESWLEQSLEDPEASIYQLSRFMFCVGYMATKELIFLELEEPEDTQKKKPVFVTSKRKKRIDNNIAAEILAICESVILTEHSTLMSKIQPIMQELTKRRPEQRNQKLEKAALKALARLMSLSSIYCVANVCFLNNLLLMSKNIIIRIYTPWLPNQSLTFRFSALTERWTPYIYLYYYYDSVSKHFNSLRLTEATHHVVSALVLENCQIADLALCIAHEDEQIKNRTVRFFNEIATKTDILYNLLPDIIIKLCDANLYMERENFRTILRFMIGLIDNHVDIELLVETLCLRFSFSSEENQWCNISYCLSLLRYSEVSIKLLIDNEQHFDDKLIVDEVYLHFTSIIRNTGRYARPKLKALLAKFETDLAKSWKLSKSWKVAEIQHSKAAANTEVLQTKAKASTEVPQKSQKNGSSKSKKLKRNKSKMKSANAQRKNKSNGRN